MASWAIRDLSAADLLAVWESGQSRSDVERSLAILAQAMPHLPPDALADLPIGRRDALLIRVRRRIFGPDFTVGCQCPFCREKLSFQATADELLAEEPAEGVSPYTVTVSHDGIRIQAQPISARDLAALPPGTDPAGMLARLLRAAITGARHRGREVPVDELPPEALDAVGKALEAADPLYVMEFSLTCPACQRGWMNCFDIVSYLWREIAAIAQSLLEEVHELALAYGWSEADILAMSPARRTYYLNRVRQ